MATSNFIEENSEATFSLRATDSEMRSNGKKKDQLLIEIGWLEITSSQISVAFEATNQIF